MKIVRFSDEISKPSSLNVVIESAIDNHQKSIAQKKLTINCDSDQFAGEIACPDDLRVAVEKYFAMAVERSPQGGEIDITAIVDQRSLEVEIADDGLDLVNRISNAFAHAERNGIEGWSERSHDLRVEPKHCPQGGVAWTMKYMRPLSARRVA